MLELFLSFNQINTEKLTDVYREEIVKNGKRFYSYLDSDKQFLCSQEYFISYLREVFFRQSGAVYAVWSAEGRYKAALRVEPYHNGLLLEALETAPDSRRKGYAYQLILGVLKHLENSEYNFLYSHIDKRNRASLNLHQKCGFSIISDHATFVDGTVTQNSYTLCYSFYK